MSSTSAIPVLTYHAMNVNGVDYADNDHVALAADLAWLHAPAWRIVPLAAAVAALFEGGAALPPRSCWLGRRGPGWGKRY